MMEHTYEWFCRTGLDRSSDVCSIIDITEELDRLDSHVEALGAVLEGDGLAGKQLEFLLQEVGREVNTVGSKSADVGLTERVVAMKGCVERLREQAANIA